MSDLISRAEAKEALRERLKRIPTYAIWAMHTIDELPTHTTPSDTLGALDCVSREDLTKGIETYFGDLPIVVHYDMLALAQRLPSVQPRRGLWIDIKHTFMTKCSVCDWINNDDSSYNFCPRCGVDMRPQFEEPEINPCRGCEDYDWKGGCKSKGGCAKSRGEVDE